MMSISRVIYKFVSGFIRLVLVLFLAFPRGCRKMITQTCLTMRVKASYASLSRRRRIVLFCIAVFAVLILLWPTGLLYGSDTPRRPPDSIFVANWMSATKQPTNPADLCIEYKLEKFRQKALSNDVVINHSPLARGEKFYPPFTGNGNIGALVDGPLYVKLNRSFSVALDYHPTVRLKLLGQRASSATVINILEGTVHRKHCFPIGETCVSVASVMYAHRRRPALLVQYLRVHNPTDTAVTVELSQIGANNQWKDVTVKNVRVAADRIIDYVLTSGPVPASDMTTNKLAVSIGSSKVPDSLTIKPAGFITATVIIAVHHAVVLATDNMEKRLEDGKAAIQQELESVAGIDGLMLTKEHSSVWTTLWSSGFGISMSLAVGALNGEQINMTQYYVLSNVPSPIYELSRVKQERNELERSLYFPDRCYEGHHTLQNAKMWRYFDSVSDIFQSVSTWLLTLEKQGCTNMLRAGADGVLQAMMLSYGAFRFSNDHLEFNTRPSDLHRDHFFRRINYGNDTHVNVSVIVNDENKAMLYVSLDRNNRPYYACDAGCLDTPVQLSRDVVSLPVKLTDPPTSILYITADKQHMEELKHAIHVHDIAEAPAHEHHVLALHRHGHSLGGLPVLFWGSIGALIIVFHLFLFKLVYNEYCAGGSGSTSLPRSYSSPPSSHRQYHYSGRQV